jgi:acetyltransferase
VDYERDLTFLAVTDEDEEVIIGDARLNVFPDLQTAELSFVVADQWQGKGIGNLLMEFCLVAAREIGLKTLLMEVMQNNTRMKQFGYKYGFQSLSCNKEDDMEEMQLSLNQTGVFLHYFHHHSGARHQREQMFKNHCR